MELRGFLVQKPFPVAASWIKRAADPLRPKTTATPSIGASRMISVIIPAHNEERYLRKTLQALRRQNYGWFEVIVVANGCTDRTREIARGLCQRLIVLSQRSLGVARNLGARMSRGEILVFLDADTVLGPMALRVIAEQFKGSDAAGTLQGRPDEDRWAYRLIYRLKNFVHRWSIHSGSSGVILCWKEQFMRVGGFDEDLAVRENSQLVKRLKRLGSYKYIGSVSATTSVRRYTRCGVRQVIWLWCRIWAESIIFDLHRKQYEAIR